MVKSFSAPNNEEVMSLIQVFKFFHLDNLRNKCKIGYRVRMGLAYHQIEFYFFKLNLHSCLNRE